MKLMYKKQKGFSVIVIIIVILAVSLTGGVGYYVYQTKLKNQDSGNTPETIIPYSGDEEYTIKKPIIYLYPNRTQEVKVRLDYSGKLVSTYPDYNKNIRGWDVIANPDGSLVNKEDNKPYSYIFWEGTQNNINYDLSSGFVAKGSETKAFLQSMLEEIGLTPKEYNEMIVYWLPQMEHNKFNLIHFAGSEYTNEAKLTISPTPDSILRVFMVFKPLNKYQEVKPQTMVPFERKGFTVIEWGGTKL
jgi:hypothetical protein